MSINIDKNKTTVNLDEQKVYMSRVAEIAKKRWANPQACVVTYGCQQNVSDSERIKGMLKCMGFGFTDNTHEADFIIFNTCAVRGHAENRVFGNVGALKHIKQKKPDMLIALCGCMMQQQHVADKIRRSYPHVDIVFGTHVMHRLPEFLWNRLTGASRIFELPDSDGEIIEGLPVHRDGGVRGILSIMYGCNNFCSYCIVPYVRGRERSREPEVIIKEAEQMVKAGYKDITLIGQNVNSYGKGESHGVNFAKLLRLLNDIEGDFRIRFMTSHPKDCTIELLDTMRDCEKVCRHLHLPFQCGSDRILKQMNRRYTKADYLTLVKAAYERMPDLNISSDVIVGFPGETYEDFLETLDVVKKVGFSQLFTFIFSPRKGTPAAKLPDPVSREEKVKWFEELLKVQEGILQSKMQDIVGKTYRVLCEAPGRMEGIVCGRTSGNMVIEFNADANLIGHFADVKVTNASNVIEGELIQRLS